MWPEHWPTITRQIATETDAAATAARSEAVPAFDEALAELAALPYEQVTAVHAGMVRELLEEHVSCQADHSRRLWSLVSFVLWHENRSRPSARAQ